MEGQTETIPGQRDKRLLGIAFMVLATLLFSVADALSKTIAQLYPFVQIIWIRSLFGLLMIATAIVCSGNLHHFYSSRPGWHLLRSLVGIVLVFGIFMGLKYIPLAEVTALVFANPLLIALYTALFMKERVTTGHFSAILLGLVGVILVLRPTPEHFHLAHLFMMGFAAATAFLIITARYLRSTESVLTLNFYLYPAAFLVTLLPALNTWQWPVWQDWLILFAISLFATLALFCVTKAMQYSTPNRVAPFDYVRLLWTLSLGYLIWGEVPSALSWLGMLVIVGSGLYIVTRETTASARE